MTFNAKEHLTNLQGRDYLEVKWRLVWFREENPDANIDSMIVEITDTTIIVKAIIYTPEGKPWASGHGTAPIGGKGSWKGREIEKAETAAIGRALAHAGYGTQFSPEDDEDVVVDAPVEQIPVTNVKHAKNGSQSASAPTEDKIGKAFDTVINMVHVKQDDDGNPFIACKLTNVRETLSLATRQPFRDAGYTECENWNDIDKAYEPTLPIPVKVQRINNTLTLIEMTPAQLESAGPKV